MIISSLTNISRPFLAEFLCSIVKRLAELLKINQKYR
jgi:hypothetical protein